MVDDDLGDIEVKDYVIYPFGEDDRIPPHTLMMDVKMTHDHFGCSTQKIRHYRQLYEDKTDSVIFLSVTANTSGRIYDDFVRLLFLHVHRETSILAGELPEESD